MRLERDQFAVDEFRDRLADHCSFFIAAHRQTLSVRKPDITHEIAIGLAIRTNCIGRKAVVGIAHGDAGHDHLVLGDSSDLAHDVRTHDALPVDDAAKPAVPGGEHDAVAERAEIEMAHRAGSRILS